MNRAPALLASLLLHAGLLGAFVLRPDSAEPPPPPPVPVKLVPPPPEGPAEVSSAPEPSPEPPAAAPEPSPEPPAAQPPPPSPPPPTPQTAPPQPAPPRPAPPRPAPLRPTTPAPAPRPTPPRPTPPRPSPTPPQPTPPRAAPPRQAPARPAPPRPSEETFDLSALGDRLARNQPRRAAKPAGATPGQLAAAKGDLSRRLATLWRPNCGVGGADLATNVSVRFRLAAGRLQGAPQLVGGRSDDPVVRAAQERAIGAIRAASPYDWLPAEMQDDEHTVRFLAEQACG